MSDWIEILKNRLENESLPLPENDWEWFETKFRQRKRRKQLAWWSTAAAAMAAAVALVILLPTGKTEEELSVVGKGPEIALVNPGPTPVPELVKGGALKQTRSLSGVEGDALSGVEGPVVRQAHQPEENVYQPEQIVQEPTDAVPEPTEGGALKQTRSLSGVEGTEWPEDTSTPRRRITISPYAGGMRQKTNAGMDMNRLMDYSVAGLSAPSYANGGLSSIHSDILYPTLEAFHVIPVSFGLEVSVPLVRKLSLSSGVDLTLFKSRFSGMIPDGENSISQRAYYLGIPLRLDLTAWENGPASIWIGAGGKVDRLIGGKYGSMSLKDNSFHWSATGVAGIRYDLIPGLGLFFQPAISYYFKPSSPAILTYRTEHPLMFSLDAGFRFTL